jgi:hypothetical protein
MRYYCVLIFVVAYTGLALRLERFTSPFEKVTA